jgi:hypothetical protein
MFGSSFGVWLVAERPPLGAASAANNVFIMLFCVPCCDLAVPSPENQYFAAKPCNKEMLSDECAQVIAGCMFMLRHIFIFFLGVLVKVIFRSSLR